MDRKEAQRKITELDQKIVESQSDLIRKNKQLSVGIYRSLFPRTLHDFGFWKLIVIFVIVLSLILIYKVLTKFNF